MVPGSCRCHCIAGIAQDLPSAFGGDSTILHLADRVALNVGDQEASVHVGWNSRRKRGLQDLAGLGFDVESQMMLDVSVSGAEGIMSR